MYQEDVFSEEEIIREIEDNADEEEEGQSFQAKLESFYYNEIDELHDSSGDPEYQQGVLGRMTACEKLIQARGYDTKVITQQEKDAECPRYNK